MTTPKWWHSGDHPIWKLASQALQLGALAFVCAYLGSESLDVKDFVGVLGGAIGGRFIGRT